MNKINNPSGQGAREICLIVHPIVKHAPVRRALGDVLGEVEGLARAINLDVAEIMDVKVARVHAAYFLTKGVRERIVDKIEDYAPSILIVNCTLSPVQQRNLERDFQCKVIDRTGLILEIFGERAQTKEGLLQVELASQEYQRSRLVRSWTHLERQRGGAGFMGGPGETQIELDRRIIGDRIVKLKKQIEDVRRTRELGRKSRERVPYPVVALVGYTNAGKSTLFNRLTGANVFAQDLLFATLDPTLRRMSMPNGQDIILSDTVGFISDLPTHLVAAFRATLEQTIHGDVLVHMIDASKPDFQAQRFDVISVLKDLGVEYDEDERVVEVYNKVDAIKDSEVLVELQRRAAVSDRVCIISAQDGRGIEEMLLSISHVLGRSRHYVRVSIPFADGGALAWLYAHGEIAQREEGENAVDLEVYLAPADLGKFEGKYTYKTEIVRG